MKKAAVFDTIWQGLIQSKSALYPWGESSRSPHSLFVNHGIFIFTMINITKQFPTLLFLHAAVCVWSGIWFPKPTFVCHMYLISSTVKFSLQQISVVLIFCLDKWVQYYDMVIFN